jgi:hypothetical protein
MGTNFNSVECDYSYSISKLTIFMGKASDGKVKDWLGDIKDDKLNLNTGVESIIIFTKQ